MEEVDYNRHYMIIIRYKNTVKCWVIWRLKISENSIIDKMLKNRINDMRMRDLFIATNYFYKHYFIESFQSLGFMVLR